MLTKCDMDSVCIPCCVTILHEATSAGTIENMITDMVELRAPLTMGIVQQHTHELIVSIDELLNAIDTLTVGETTPTPQDLAPINSQFSDVLSKVIRLGQERLTLDPKDTLTTSLFHLLRFLVKGTVLSYRTRKHLVAIRDRFTAGAINSERVMSPMIGELFLQLNGDDLVRGEFDDHGREKSGGNYKLFSELMMVCSKANNDYNYAFTDDTGRNQEILELNEVLADSLREGVLSPTQALFTHDRAPDQYVQHLLSVTETVQQKRAVIRMAHHAIMEGDIQQVDLDALLQVIRSSTDVPPSLMLIMTQKDQRWNGGRRFMSSSPVDNWDGIPWRTR